MWLGIVSLDDEAPANTFAGANSVRAVKSRCKVKFIFRICQIKKAFLDVFGVYNLEDWRLRRTFVATMTDEAKRWDCLTEGSEEVRAGQGRNRIPPPEQEPLWKGFLRKFQDPLMVVLLVVFVFSVAVSVYEILYAGRSLSALMEPAGVLAALLLATGVGFLFEVRAEREFRILNRKKDERPVKVLRRRPGEVRPQTRLVAKRDVCVGDVVRLENGDEVPADARLLQARAMHVDESAFTIA